MRIDWNKISATQIFDNEQGAKWFVESQILAGVDLSKSYRHVDGIDAPCPDMECPVREQDRRGWMYVRDYAAYRLCTPSDRVQLVNHPEGKGWLAAIEVGGRYVVIMIDGNVHIYTDGLVFETTTQNVTKNLDTRHIRGAIDLIDWIDRAYEDWLSVLYYFSR